jgi:hypothetical protein
MVLIIDELLPVLDEGRVSVKKDVLYLRIYLKFGYYIFFP